jgi:hypothetical protein
MVQHFQDYSYRKGAVQLYPDSCLWKVVSSLVYLIGRLVSRYHGGGEGLHAYCQVADRFSLDKVQPSEYSQRKCVQLANSQMSMGSVTSFPIESLRKSLVYPPAALVAGLTLFACWFIEAKTAVNLRIIRSYCISAFFALLSPMIERVLMRTMQNEHDAVSSFTSVGVWRRVFKILRSSKMGLQSLD